MTHDDIKQVLQEYHQAALNAVAAGFDGIELHAERLFSQPIY